MQQSLQVFPKEYKYLVELFEDNVFEYYNHTTKDDRPKQFVFKGVQAAIDLEEFAEQLEDVYGNIPNLKVQSARNPYGSR